MSIEDQIFLQGLGNTRATNIEREEKKYKKRFAGDIPKTLQEYADQQGITLAQARAELKEKGVRLQGPTGFKDITKGLAGVTAANYDLEQNLEELPSGRVVAKNRPKNFGRFATGLLDIMTLGFSDFDQQASRDVPQCRTFCFRCLSVSWSAGSGRPGRYRRRRQPSHRCRRARTTRWGYHWPTVAAHRSRCSDRRRWGRS